MPSSRIENGTYSTGVLPVTVDSLPNAKRFMTNEEFSAFAVENCAIVRYNF